MPVVGVASKLRQPSAVGSKPVHTALPIPSAVRAATSQGYMARQQDLRPSEGAPGLSCQLSVKSEYQQERTTEGKSRAETEESKICKVSGDKDLLCVSLRLCGLTAWWHHRCQVWKNQRCQMWRSLFEVVMLSVPSRAEQVSPTVFQTAMSHVCCSGLMLWVSCVILLSGWFS